MNKIGVLIANSSKAKFVHFHGNSHNPPLETLAEFTHEESRLKRQELVSDRPGHFHTSTSARSAYGEDRDPKEATKNQFALELAKQLDTYRKEGFTKFVLVSPAHFSGMIEKHLQKETANLIWDTVHKDYTQWADKDLLPMLHEELRPRIVK